MILLYQKLNKSNNGLDKNFKDKKKYLDVHQ